MIATPTDGGSLWHTYTPDDTVSALASDAVMGLDPGEVARRRERHGDNILPEPKPEGPVIRFLRQFRSLLILVLLAAAAVTALLGHWIDTGVILLVVLVNATIGFLQEGKAERALEAIRQMLAPQATVLRDGRRQTIDGQGLVPGDIVVLEAGDRVPADLRLVSVRGGFRVVEAALTGESVPVNKTLAPAAGDAALADRHCLAFSGTLVAAGQARGVVFATGTQTEIGRVSHLMATVQQVQTPLLRQMAVFAKWLTLFILAAAAVILTGGLLVGGYDFTELFMAVVGLSVAAIPEGLPAILTVTLAIGVESMARRHAIVRRLPAIETLGAVSVICSDKTGTLTRNEMTVASLATSARLFEVTGTGYDPTGGFQFEGAPAAVGDYPMLGLVSRAALLCSEAEVAEVDGTWQVTGDPMEGALVTLAAKAGLDPAAERRAQPQTDMIPFDAQHRFMATLHHDHAGHAAVFVKGAPERLLAMCDHQRAEDGGDVPIMKDLWRERAEAIARQGQRVLAIGIKPVSTEQTTLSFDDVDRGVVMIGLVGLIDPPRPEAISAVAACQTAGISVKMITGDHAVTASAIAAALGLGRPERVLQGADIDGLDQATLRRAVAETNVFARTSPDHKLRLVEALQADGAVVAMTGDGVNDAPALKRADIGIAMGKKGTEAAKQASEMVLADDNFATIAAAVAAGRTVYDNLKKAILFLLPVNGGEALSLVAALLLGLTLPIAPAQILWVNMVSSVVLAMTLAFEPQEPNVMRRPPRPMGAPILSRFVLWRIGFVSTLFAVAIFGKFTLAQAQGSSVEEARTIAVNTLVVMEIFYLFSVRYLHAPSITVRGVLGTRAVLYAIAAVVALQLLFTYAPFMSALFDTRPLSLEQGLLVIATGVAVLGIMELEKRLTGGPDRASAGATQAASG